MINNQNRPIRPSTAVGQGPAKMGRRIPSAVSSKYGTSRNRRPQGSALSVFSFGDNSIEMQTRKYRRRPMINKVSMFADISIITGN